VLWLDAQMIAALVIGVGVALFALWLASRARRYAVLFAAPHLLEVARGLARAKTAALARVIRDERDVPTAPDDPRIVATSAGIAIVYTVSERPPRFVHHCSVSAMSGPTPHAVGGAFVMFVAKLLGLAQAELECFISASTVHHAELSLDAARHAALAAAPIPTLTPAALADLRRDALEARSSVNWQPASVAPARPTPP
jgi:hypothetical protein